MTCLLDNLLDLVETTVEGYQEVEGYVCLHLKLLNRGTHCPHCNYYTAELHQTTQILVRDLSSFGKPVYLRVPRRRFYCPKCQRYSTEKIEFLAERRNYTKRYEQHIYERVLSSNVAEISRIECLSCAEVEGIFRRISSEKKRLGTSKKADNG